MTSDRSDSAMNPHFIGLVLSLEASAMQSLGKIANGPDGKVERDLRQAQVTIDMLGMLEKKTAGNLTTEESALLKRALYQLRMNYLDELKSEPKPGEQASGSADKKSGQNGPEQP